MKQSRFTKESCLDRAECPSPGPRAFGATASNQGRFGRENSPRFGGRALIEYAIICALIAVAIVAGVGTFGDGVHRTWSNVDQEVSGAVTYTTN